MIEGESQQGEDETDLEIFRRLQDKLREGATFLEVPIYNAKGKRIGTYQMPEGEPVAQRTEPEATASEPGQQAAIPIEPSLEDTPENTEGIIEQVPISPQELRRRQFLEFIRIDQDDTPRRPQEADQSSIGEIEQNP